MMKTILAGILAILSLASVPASGQRTCGNSVVYDELRAKDPAAYQRLMERRQHESLLAQQNGGAASKSTADQSPIPVVFHLVLSQSQYIALGRDTGIRRRVVSQLAVLNRDFNRENEDSTLIPADFRSRFGNGNIRFGLANQSSAHTINVGIELKFLTATPFYNINNGCRGVKENSPMGLEAWDPSKFLNIWVVNTPGSVLGVTVGPQNKGETWSDRLLDASDLGVVLNYGAFGMREHSNQYFLEYNDGGRTLTHEVGHFFTLRHIWGDDDGVNPNGYCPGDMLNNVMVGFDDFINDTPPQSRSTYCVGSVCPSFPKLDACSPNTPGIMFMNYMDYVNDAAMQMFTKDQATVMQAEVAQGGRSHSLTQNPWLISVGIPKVSSAAFHVYPNPASNRVQIVLAGTERLEAVQLVNMTGQVLRKLETGAGREFELQTADLPRGMYFVKCRFAEGTLSRKIVLQ